jgi:hypothetical protein
MKAASLFKKSIICLFFIVLSVGANAQQKLVHHESADLTATILERDSLFWLTYNTCNLEQMRTFFSQDLEFYHDKGGLTSTSESLLEAMKKGICQNKELTVRREVIKGSLQVYPLNNYGAILTGEHKFYVKEKGKPERPDGIAKFTHVWQHTNKEWKMTRVLSYDHQPITAAAPTSAIEVPKETLLLYTGKYQGTNIKDISITLQNGALHLEAGGMKTFIQPLSENKFALTERNLEFEFIKTNTRTEKMIVRENGQIVEEARKIK